MPTFTTPDGKKITTTTPNLVNRLRNERGVVEEKAATRKPAAQKPAESGDTKSKKD